MNIAKIRTRNAFPFWLSLGTVPLLWLGAAKGGLFTILVPIYAWYLFAALDALFGENLDNADPETDEDKLFWYRLVTLIWFPVQFTNIFGLIWFVTHTDHLRHWKCLCCFSVLALPRELSELSTHTSLCTRETIWSDGSETCCFRPCSIRISEPSTCLCIMYMLAHAAMR